MVQLLYQETYTLLEKLLFKIKRLYLNMHGRLLKINGWSTILWRSGFYRFYYKTGSLNV
jgi:hypothetical protein